MHTHKGHTAKTHAPLPGAQLHLKLHAVLPSAVLWDRFARALPLSVKIKMHFHGMSSVCAKLHGS